MSGWTDADRRAGEVTLTRRLTADNSFEKWVKDAHVGAKGDTRKRGAIIVYDDEGNPVRRYPLGNVWPKSVEIGSPRAGETAVLTEKLVLTYEHLDVE